MYEECSSTCCKKVESNYSDVVEGKGLTKNNLTCLAVPTRNEATINVEAQGEQKNWALRPLLPCDPERD